MKYRIVNRQYKSGDTLFNGFEVDKYVKLTPWEKLTTIHYGTTHEWYCTTHEWVPTMSGSFSQLSKAEIRIKYLCDSDAIIVPKHKVIAEYDCNQNK